MNERSYMLSEVELAELLKRLFDKSVIVEVTGDRIIVREDDGKGPGRRVHL